MLFLTIHNPKNPKNDNKISNTILYLKRYHKEDKRIDKNKYSRSNTKKKTEIKRQQITPSVYYCTKNYCYKYAKSFNSYH